jgi:hypothetical protein
MRAFLFAALVFAIAQSSPEGTGIIEGRVVRFGTTEGLPNVEITLRIGTTATARISPDAISDADGRFILRNIVPGPYTIQAVRGGYVHPSPNGVRLTNGGATASLVVTQGQHLQNVNLSMVRGAVIAGRALDEHGQPLVNVRVNASPVRPGPGNPVTTSTNDRGEYRLFGLESGKYRVELGGSRGMFGLARSIALTYFPGVANPAEATALTVVDSQVLTAVDFRP